MYPDLNYIVYVATNSIYTECNKMDSGNSSHVHTTSDLTSSVIGYTFYFTKNRHRHVTHTFQVLNIQETGSKRRCLFWDKSRMFLFL